MLPNGTLAKQTERLFADLGGSEPGNPDGMKVDTAGNVYSGGAGGIYILRSETLALGSGEGRGAKTISAKSLKGAQKKPKRLRWD
jgi:hypothetical protein